MARGQKSKTYIQQELLKNFKGAFLYNDGKEIRIPLQEDGEDIQIKVSLTCAKDNVVPGEDNALPTAADNRIDFSDIPEEKEVKKVVPTEEEKENVDSLLKALGLKK